MRLRGESGTRRSVAVVPFRDLSPGGEQQHLAEGLAEDLLNGLTHNAALEVAPRSSSFDFADADAHRVASELEVSHVLEGSVRRWEDRIRVTARLVDGERGRNVWARTFDRALDDMFAVQDEITAGVLSALEVELVEPDGGAPRPYGVDPEAYDLFLRGRHYWNRRYEVDLQTSLDFFQEALSRDSDFAEAYASVA